MTAPLCPNNHGPTSLVTGRVVYPHRPDLYSKHFWRCARCTAVTGCHPGTTRPLGVPALPQTRTARGRAHAAFDPLWKSGRMTRGEAYAWISKEMGIDPLHIGELSERQCEDLIAIVVASRGVE
ncbi:MAG TPA: zinc-finger-containing protein [Polyangiaceae bacterium]|jgi:hypothetical protein